MRRKITHLLCTALCFLPASAALACSVISEYVKPTNFELVQLADAIVVAKALSQKNDAPPHDSSVIFEVQSTLKGQTPGRFSIGWGSLGSPGLGDPEELANPHPDAFRGMCTRGTFSKGKAYVIFLEKEKDGSYRQLTYPFTRVNEDYFGPDSLWVRTIETYVDIQQRFAPMEQLAELERSMHAKLKDPSETNRKQAADILDHLASRSPYKPTQYLMETYETLERNESPDIGLRSRAADQEQSTAQALTELVLGKTHPDAPTREEQMEFVLTSLVRGEHPTAAPLFERLLANDSIRPRTLGLALRFLEKHGQFTRAFGIVQTRALSLLPLSSPREGQKLITDIAQVMDGDGPEGSYHWQTDLAAKSKWPEIALKLFWYQYHAFGADHAIPFTDEIDSLPLTDYRLRPELTLARAKNYDEDVAKWAIREVSNEKQRLAFEARLESDDHSDNLVDPADLPLQALVLAYGEKRYAALEKVFCQGEIRRGSLINYLGQWGDSLDQDLIRRMAVTPDVSEEERDMLGMALAQIHVRETQGRQRMGGGRGWFDSYDNWYESLRKDVSGESKDAKPIECKR